MDNTGNFSLGEHQPTALNNPQDSKILVVDDDPMTLRLVERELGSRGYVCVCVSSVEEGLEKMKEFTPDLVLTDYMFEGLSGLDLLKQIHEDGLSSGVIVMTGSVKLEPAIEAMRLGAYEYLSKPFSSDAILMSVERVLTKRKLLVENEHFYSYLNQALVKKLEEKSVQLSVEMDKGEKVAQKNQQLQTQFLQAQKMEAIGQLAGGIAHDFNNLLSVILGYSDFALKSHHDGGTMDSIVDDIGEIKGAATRAATLTRQLLAFSRLQVLHPVVMNLNDSIIGLEKMFDRLIGENIKFITNLDAGTEPVKADPGQIEQVIMNLIVNARDAMPNGGKLTIETHNISLQEKTLGEQSFAVRPGPYVMMSVTDTGCGIEESTLPRIFEPFFTTKEKGKGTGLGLSTVFGIIKQSDGYILVDSTVGKGTTFRVYLPSAVDDAVKENVPEEVLPSSSHRAESIMLVEDDEKMRAMIKRFLEPKFDHICEAANGEDALAICGRQKETIHLLITDILLPGINGVDLATKLHATHPETKILYMSGYSERTKNLPEMPGLKTSFLSKPFTADNLLHQVFGILGIQQKSTKSPKLSQN